MSSQPRAPLADRMRPTDLDGFFGQAHLLAPGKPLREAILHGRLHSMIFWGPPGTGKTTLARIAATRCNAQFLSLSAVLSGVKDIRESVQKARQVRESEGRATILFIDEVHRFNKSQQDAFLPHVEDGTLTFIGATTENPSFELNNALLSRARTYVLETLGREEIQAVLHRAMADPEHGLGDSAVTLPDASARLLAEAADGDARRALNLLEQAATLCKTATIAPNTLGDVIAGRMARLDKGGDTFYDQISALHKSVRGSSPDAALYWLARMIDGGCDPLYIARRLVRMASEDIGNADPRALGLAIDAWDTQQRLGSPEGELALAQAVVYLSCAAKSNALYTAWKAALEDARRTGSAEVPLHLRNAPTRLMKDLGYGRTYRYAHDEPEAYAAGETYFPDRVGERTYYRPTDRGLEIRIREKLERLKTLDQAAQQQHDPPAEG